MVGTKGMVGTSTVDNKTPFKIGVLEKDLQSSQREMSKVTQWLHPVSTRNYTLLTKKIINLLPAFSPLIMGTEFF